MVVSFFEWSALAATMAAPREPTTLSAGCNPGRCKGRNGPPPCVLRVIVVQIRADSVCDRTAAPRRADRAPGRPAADAGPVRGGKAAPGAGHRPRPGPVVRRTTQVLTLHTP